MANILWIDIESTGLGVNAAVIEIAAIPMVDGEILPHFHSMIKPHDGASLDPKAFEITKININEIWGYPEAKDVLGEFIKWIDSYETIFSLGGWNVSFDRRMLFKLFCRNSEYGSFITRFSNNDTDALRICRDIFKGKRNKPVDFKLESVCGYFEIPNRIYHRALGDIQNTIAVFLEIEKLVVKKEEQQNPELSYLEKRRKYLDMKYIQMNPEGDVFITKDALKDKQVTKFILNFLYERHCSEV